MLRYHSGCALRGAVILAASTGCSETQAAVFFNRPAPWLAQPHFHCPAVIPVKSYAIRSASLAFLQARVSDVCKDKDAVLKVQSI